MASSYLPEKTYVVCNNQASMEYRELLADSDMRAVSVYYKDKRAFLTKVDKKLCSDFTCKTAWSKGLSRSAFVGGMGLGLGVAIASASVPVIGWIPTFRAKNNRSLDSMHGLALWSMMVFSILKQQLILCFCIFLFFKKNSP